jgi:hypothetical protein
MTSLWTIGTLTLGIMISGCFLTPLADAQPFPGGLPRCIEERTQCQKDLAACSEGKEECQNDLAVCDAALQACRSGGCESDADCQTGNACVNNQCTFRPPYCSNTFLPPFDPPTTKFGRYVVTSELSIIDCHPYTCRVVTIGLEPSQYARCLGIGCGSSADCTPGFVCDTNEHCVPKTEP